VIVSNTRDLLRLNVGFVIHQTVGYSRDFPFEILSVQLDPELDLKDLIGTARVTRTAQGLLLQVRMKATVQAQCVRCLEEFEQPLNIDFTELYAFSPNSITESGLMVPETGKIDLAPLIREEMFVAIPIGPLCREDCRGLCSICGEPLDGADHNHEDTPVDPRLDVLRSLLSRVQSEPPAED